VIENQARVSGCEAVVEFDEGTVFYPALINDQKMYEHIKKVGSLMLGQRNVLLCEPTMGGEDFSFYTEKVPGAMFFLGAKNKSENTSHTFHSPYFSLDEDTLPLGAAMNAAIAEMYIESAQSV
jgi:IAA-amino acid hydrolase